MSADSLLMGIALHGYKITNNVINDAVKCSLSPIYCEISQCPALSDASSQG